MKLLAILLAAVALAACSGVPPSTQSDLATQGARFDFDRQQNILSVQNQDALVKLETTLATDQKKLYHAQGEAAVESAKYQVKVDKILAGDPTPAPDATPNATMQSNTISTDGYTFFYDQGPSHVKQVETVGSGVITAVAEPISVSGQVSVANEPGWRIVRTSRGDYRLMQDGNGCDVAFQNNGITQTSDTCGHIASELMNQNNIDVAVGG